MRMTLVISTLCSGGAERVMSTLANSWCAMGREVTILTTHDAGHAPDYALAPDVNIVSVDPGCGGLKRQVEIVKRIRREVKLNHPDVIVSFLNYTNIMVLVGTRGLGVPLIISERLDPSVINIGLTWSLLRRWTYRWTNILVAQTPTAAKRFESLAPGQVRVIPNPVTELTMEPGANDPVSFDKPTFLAIGRLNPQKGFDVLIKAMTLVREQEPNWQLVILGEGDSRTNLEKLIEAQDQTNAIRLHGRVRNPWPWLLAANVFVLSSHSEGFPNALCEAMIAGVPVISTDCPSGPSDLIHNGEDGLLVTVNDVQSLADSMLLLARSNEMRALLGANARKIGTRYELPVVLDKWDLVIAEAQKNTI
jgi:GalNAc-alpha-(1->4)-GalNAc-alpha-(1->3)-diNAcBac-PP-undecaprenol alpha-1,4-N-acetyl-D-galactosaminyltransferase